MLQFVLYAGVFILGGLTATMVISLLFMSKQRDNDESEK